MNEIEQHLCDLDERQINYITFLLGADNFEICKFIRETAKDFGAIDMIYDDCISIAKKFVKYDKKNQDIMSEYESFEHFIDDYDKEIRDFISNDIDFEVE
jgi:hypothetical protein